MTILNINIDTPYTIREQQIQSFRKNGFIKLKNVFSAEELECYRSYIARIMCDYQSNQPPVENRDTYGKAFLQLCNLWEKCERTKEFVFGKRLAKLATDLLGTQGIRLYHDQALFKEPCGGFTPWHVDQNYWPMASEQSITAWIPLRPVSMDMGPLEFCAGSQRILEGRNLKISDTSEREIEENLKVSDCPVVREPYALGEVSFHYGYTFHRAGPNNSKEMREIMTIIYADEAMKIGNLKGREHELQNFCPGTVEGGPMNSPKNPVLYSKT